MSLKYITSLSLLGVLLSNNAFAENATEPKDQKTKDYNKTILERVTIIGDTENINDIAGAVHYIDKQELKKNNYTDVNRVLRKVPGVNIQEEEGYGNRPNIGLRGGRSDRSADITLMEDGVLIAPAPYAAPAAYYFPRVNRMEGIEIRKGSSTIKSGPRTTSGAVNFLSSSVPETEEFDALMGYGSNNTQRGEVHYGNTIDNFGFVLDASTDSTDGFKKLNNGGDTGYSIQDIMGKLKLQADKSARFYQSIEFKIGATQEESNETYLGLTNDDFRDNSNRRYAASQEDIMDSDHQNYMLRHFIDLNNFDITTTAYHHDFSRNWYRLQSATVGGVTKGIADSLNSVPHLNALRGGTNLNGSSTDNLKLRANDRTYYSQGVQSNIGTDFATGMLNHKLEIGGRFHRDSEDRFQHEDSYGITNGSMNLVSSGTAGSQANAEATADAFAAFVADDIEINQFTISPGLRYEHIKLENNNRASNVIRKNTVDAFVPGLGLAYNINDKISVFTGVHKGFAPPAPTSTQDDIEESINYELGTRFMGDIIQAEFIGYLNDYSNLIGECTFSSGCNGNIGDQFNAGKVRAFGIETSLSSDIGSAFDWQETSLPVGMNYTYTHAEFKNSFISGFSEWGNVNAGDDLPYIAPHQVYVHAGIAQPTWEMHLGGKFMDKMRGVAGSGSIPTGQGTDSHFIMDIAAEKQIHDNTRGFVTIDNVFDRDYVASRRPAGARPGKPFTILTGLKFSLN